MARPRPIPLLVPVVLVVACTAGPEPPPHRATGPPPPGQPVTAPAPTGEDQTDALQRFIDSIPDGGTGELRPGAEYVVDGTLRITGRTGITLIGNGATIRATRLVGFRPGVGWRRHLVIEDSRRITVRGLSVRSVGEGDLHPEYYGEHAVAVLGSRRVRLRGMEISGAAGDAVYVSASPDTGARSRDVRISRLDVTDVGRHGLAVVDGTGIVLRSSTVSGCFTFVDLEPHRPKDAVETVRIVGNTVGAVATVFVGAYGLGLVRDVTVAGNRAMGTSLRSDIGIPGFPPRRDFAFVENVSMRPLGPNEPPLFRLWGVRGFRLTGNRQPFAGDQVAVHGLGSCGLVAAGNSLPGAGGLFGGGPPCRWTDGGGNVTGAPVPGG